MFGFEVRSMNPIILESNLKKKVNSKKILSCVIAFCAVSTTTHEHVFSFQEWKHTPQIFFEKTRGQHSTATHTYVSDVTLICNIHLVF